MLRPTLSWGWAQSVMGAQSRWGDSGKRWKEPEKVPGEEPTEAEPSRGYPGPQVGKAVPSRRSITSKGAGTCECECVCVHVCGWDTPYNHGPSIYTMPASVGHGKQVCPWAEWCQFLEVSSPFCGVWDKSGPLFPATWGSPYLGSVLCLYFRRIVSEILFLITFLF